MAKGESQGRYSCASARRHACSASRSARFVGWRRTVASRSMASRSTIRRRGAVGTSRARSSRPWSGRRGLARRAASLDGTRRLRVAGGGLQEAPAPQADRGGEAALQESEPLEFASVEEMQVEIEILDNEIRGLEEYLAANPDWTSSPVRSRPACRPGLGPCRATPRAARWLPRTRRRRQFLRAATARIEHVKRLLGVAEEMGIDFEPTGESLPPVD